MIALEWWPWLALGATIALEVPLLLFFLRHEAFDRRDLLVMGLAMNCVTHPLAWNAIVAGHWNWWLVEGLVVLAEGLLLRAMSRLPLWRTLLIALALNIVSAGVSWLIPWGRV